MSGTREKRIINGLLMLCLAAGFACFALVLLPNQVGRAGALQSVAPERSRISSVIELPQPEPQKARAAPTQGIFARFVPEAATDNARPAPEFEPDASFEQDFLPAGGPGIAVDDGAAESALEYAGAGRTSAMVDEEFPVDLSPQDPLADAEPEAAAPRLPASARAPEAKSYPHSSLALRSGSSKKGSRAKPPAWMATPPGLEQDVAFWRDIYARYDKSFVVLHHPRYLGIVYEIVDLRDIDRNPRINDIEREHMRKRRVDDRREAVIKVLERLGTSPHASTLSSEEKRIKALFEGVDEPDKYRRAAREHRVRGQLGQSDKFITGLRYSNRYLGEIEKIFRMHGLPVELTRLIFVESMFMTQVRSSAGASGVWQFMPATGRRFLRINDIYDERNDPIVSTHAAAKYLSQNYRELGSWPLAINAYNTGRGRISQAIKQLGTRDIGRIIREFRHPGYGFASRNFFLEFLAAYEVAENYEKYFGRIEFDPPLSYEEVVSDYHISLPEVAKLARIPAEALADINPSLSSKTLSGSLLLPAGTPIRVPEGRGELFAALASRAPKSSRGPIHHVVRSGDTLASISAIYGVPPADLMKENKTGRNVRPGQTLRIPAR